MREVDSAVHPSSLQQIKEELCLGDHKSARALEDFLNLDGEIESNWSVFIGTLTQDGEYLACKMPKDVIDRKEQGAQIVFLIVDGQDESSLPLGRIETLQASLQKLGYKAEQLKIKTQFGSKAVFCVAPGYEEVDLKMYLVSELERTNPRENPGRVLALTTEVWRRCLEVQMMEEGVFDEASVARIRSKLITALIGVSQGGEMSLDPETLHVCGEISAGRIPDVINFLLSNLGRQIMNAERRQYPEKRLVALRGMAQALQRIWFSSDRSKLEAGEIAKISSAARTLQGALGELDEVEIRGLLGDMTPDLVEEIIRETGDCLPSIPQEWQAQGARDVEPDEGEDGDSEADTWSEDLDE
jgi:hypothetical protein